MASPTGKRPAVERLHLEPTSFAPRISRQSPVLYWATAPVHTTSLTSSRGNAARPREAARTDEIRTHSASRGIGRSAAIKAATGAYMICSLAVLRPIPGRDHRAAPKGLRRAVRTRAAPYTSPSLTLVCLLQADVRPSAFHASRAFQDPATKGPKHKRARTRIARQDRPPTVLAHS